MRATAAARKGTERLASELDSESWSSHPLRLVRRLTVVLILAAALAVACEETPEVIPQHTSKPKPTVTVPDLVGLPIADAQLELESNALDVQVQSKCSPERRKTIIEQSPSAGSQVGPGTIVRLITAVPLCPVPVVFLEKLERARQKLRAHGFQVRVVKRVDNVLEPGTVIEYRPGGHARLGRVVTLVVAERSGPCDPSYPDVCIPPYPPDLNCSDVPYTNIRVIGADPHGLDGYDNDGVGCET
jgi:hypothetical protein